MTKGLSLRIIRSLLLPLFLILLLLLTGCSGGGTSQPDDETGPEKPVALSGESWMSYSRDDIGHRRLNDIAIPGTHDSGTYGITANSRAADDKKGLATVMEWLDLITCNWYYNLFYDFGVVKYVDDRAKEITSWWAKVQRTNFLAQLQGGIRYFDLRVQQWDSSTFYCVHSMLGANLNDLFTAIQTFYGNSTSSREILILDFQHTFDVNHDAFVAMLKARLKDAYGNSLLIPRGANLNINTIWSTNQRILVFYDDVPTVSKTPELWYSSSCTHNAQMWSPWPNTNNRNILSGFLTELLYNNRVDKVRKSGNFTITQSLSTEHAAEVALSIEAHVFSEFGHVPIIGGILRRLGFDRLGPMNFFDFNFGGQVLADWLNNAANRNKATTRANILIIDDHANFTYTRAAGGTGNYVDLICELNKGRNAPRPYRMLVTRQTPNFTANHFQPYTVDIYVMNTGTLAWDPAVVFLGTADDYDRESHLYTNDGNWISRTRIRMQGTSAVEPGEEALFRFTVTPDVNYTSSYQSFELVAAQAYQGTPAQWFGEDYGNTAIYIDTDVLAYASQLKSKTPVFTIAQFDTATLTATFTNTGTMPWYPDAVFLGLPRAVYGSVWHTPGAENWTSSSRIRMQNTRPVMKGEDAVFTFPITANLGVVWGFQGELVADKAVGPLPAGWFGYQGNAQWHLPIVNAFDSGALAAELVSKSPDCTIARDTSQTLQIVLKNTGTISWYPDIMYLEPEGGASDLYTDDENWFSVDGIMMQNTAPVKPGEEATFTFSATPNASFASGNQNFQLIMRVYAVAYSKVPGGMGTIHVTVTN